MTLHVDPVWSWPAVAAAATGLIALVAVTYPRRVAHLAPARRRTLLALRIAAALALALAMLRPEVRFEETGKKSALVYVVTDASRSMNTLDGPGGISRRAALLSLLGSIEPQLKAIGGDVELRWFDFGTELVPVEKPGDKADGPQTALGGVLKSIRRGATDDRRLMGVFLLSDGAQRAVPPFDDPRTEARLLGPQNIPVFTVPIGGTGLSDTAVDLAVEDLLVNPGVFEKKTVAVTARVRAVGAANRKLDVRLLVEDRAGKKPGEAGEMKVPETSRQSRPRATIETTKNADVIPVELTFVPDRPGEFKIALEVVPLEGEIKPANNRKETIITVLKGGITVAYIDKVRPEQKFVRLAGRSDKVQLDFQPIRSGKFGPLTAIDPDLFKPGKYDAYILGDVPAETLGAERLKELAARVRGGAGLLMIGGYRSFGNGGYAETPLAELLPVAMLPAERQTGDEIDPNLHYLKPLKMLPTPRGLSHYLMRLGGADERAAWEALAPLEGANKLRRKSDFVEILAETEDGAPLLLAQEAGATRVAAFAGDTTYQWVLNGQRDAHQRFWRQMILWLSHKEADTDTPVWATVNPRNFVPGQPAPLEFGARTDAGEPIPDAVFTVAVIDPNRRETSLAPRRSGTQHTAQATDTATPGDWWVRVAATRDGQPYASPAWTRFIVDARDLELDNPASDPGLLRDIAELTGGMLVPPEKLGETLAAKHKDGDFQLREISDYRTLRLWDGWPFLLTFVALMTAEWALRKRYGLV